MKGMVADPEECDMVSNCISLLFAKLKELKDLTNLPVKTFCIICTRNQNIIIFFQEELMKLQEIPNSLAVFCMATYGEGDPTDNSMEFYEWIKNGEPDLTGLNYAVSIISNIQVTCSYSRYLVTIFDVCSTE